MKRRVTQFYLALFLIVVALLIIQIVQFGGFAGYVISNGDTNFVSGKNAIIEAKILDYKRIKNLLYINLIIKENSGEHQEIGLNYTFLDSDNIIVKQGSKRMVISGGSSDSFILTFELPKDSFGQFSFELAIESSKDRVFLKKEIFLSEEGVTGLAISNSNRSNLFLLIIIIFSLLVLIFVFRILYKKKEMDNSIIGGERNFVKLDLSSEA
jgi:hypothetical protein